MPYASNISIAVLDDNVLESQAIETLSAIGLSYEKYKTANNVYFNIIGTLSDSELNKINNYVDEYYKQWGKQYVRFNVNLKNQDTNNSSLATEIIDSRSLKVASGHFRIIEEDLWQIGMVILWISANNLIRGLMI